MLIDELKRRKIIISLRPLKPNDLAANWEIKAIIEKPDIFDISFLYGGGEFDDFAVGITSSALISSMEMSFKSGVISYTSFPVCSQKR